MSSKTPSRASTVYSEGEADFFKIEGLLRSIALLFTLSLLLGACADDGRTDAATTVVTTRATSTTATPKDVSTTRPARTTTTQTRGSTTTTISLELGEELVFNGDFSAGSNAPDGWELTVDEPRQTVEKVVESGEEHISFFSPLEEEISWPEARSTVPFEVEAHTEYRLSVEARTVTEGRLFLALVFLDEDGDQILLRGPGSPEVPQPDWGTIGATLESPVDAASAYLVMRLAVRPDLSEADSFSVDVNRVSVKEVQG